jgi:hypothetical protein
MPHNLYGRVRKDFLTGMRISNHPHRRVAIVAILARSTANIFTYNIINLRDVCDEIHFWKQILKLLLRCTTDDKICMAYILGVTDSTKSFRLSRDVTQ